MATTTLPSTASKVKQQSSIPTRKVLAGGVAGAAVTVLMFVLNTYLLPADKPLSAEVAAALTTVLSFVISYLVPPSAKDDVTAA